MKRIIRILTGDGSYDSEESIRILKEEADIVVTNPPFSKFRDYIRILMEYKKKFIVLGALNAVKYKEVFPLIQSNQIWLGTSPHTSKIFEIVEPEIFAPGKVIYDENEIPHVKVQGICWFTNLDTKKRHEPLLLFKTYAGHEDEYPSFDYYPAINIDKTKDIPADYKGRMGVPISFMDKYCPEQFRIINALNTYLLLEEDDIEEETGHHMCTVGNKIKYTRIIIQRI